METYTMKLNMYIHMDMNMKVYSAKSLKENNRQLKSAGTHTSGGLHNWKGVTISCS